MSNGKKNQKQKTWIIALETSLFTPTILWKILRLLVNLMLQTYCNLRKRHGMALLLETSLYTWTILSFQDFLMWWDTNRVSSGLEINVCPNSHLLISQIRWVWFRPLHYINDKSLWIYLLLLFFFFFVGEDFEIQFKENT